MLKLHDESKITYHLKFRRTGEITILAIADLHCASYTGLLPDGCTRKNGALISQSEYQKILWDRVVEKAKEIGKVDILIDDGDNVEGRQLRFAGMTLSDPDTDVGVNIAVNAVGTIASIVKPEIILCPLGTGTHVAKDIGGNLDYQVARELAKDYTVHTGQIIDIQIGEMKWYIRHTIPSSRVNEYLGLENMYTEFAKVYIAQRTPQLFPDVVCCAHTHKCVGPAPIRQRMYGMTLPCLKLADDNYQRGYPFFPDIGMMYIEQDGGDLFGRFHRLFTN